MACTVLQVLIVEDSERDAALLIRALQRGGYEPTHERVETADAMRTALQRDAWDVVLADYKLPRFSAPAAFELIKDMGLDLPFIIVSGTIGEEAAAEALRAGVHDFIIKGKLARLVPAIEREVREAQLRRDRLAERAQAEAERERLIRELRDAVQARDAFLAIASHEMKTPLTSLMLVMQGLSRRKRRDLLSTMSIEKLETKLETIARQVNRLNALVRNLLDVARITSARMKLSRERVDLGDLVANVAAQSDELIRRSKSDLALHLSSGHRQLGQTAPRNHHREPTRERCEIWRRQTD